MFLLSVFWMLGIGVLWLWLKNVNTKVTYTNVDTAFVLGAALGLFAAFIGQKANLQSWMTWIAYAAGGVYVTGRLLKKKKDNPLVLSSRPGVYGGVSPTDKDEKRAWFIVRLIAALFLAAFTLWGFVFPADCDVDKVFLACRITWTVWDVIGLVGLAFGILVLSGLHKGSKDLFNPENSSLWNYVLAGELLVSIVLIWNA